MPVFPFQFRYTPPKSKVGSTVKLTAEAIDKAGNKSTRDLLVNIVDTDDLVLSPVPVDKPTLSGTPVVGQTHVLPQRRVPQQPALVRVRRGCAAASRSPEPRR